MKGKVVAELRVSDFRNMGIPSAQVVPRNLAIISPSIIQEYDTGVTVTKKLH